MKKQAPPPASSVVVSLIATTLNCKEGLEDCLRQLLQEVDGDRILEIVIVDGGSTDGTWELLQEIANSCSYVRIFQEQGANISQGRNLAVQYSRGNVIVSFDSGCEMLEGYVATLIQPFIDDPYCDVVGAKTIAVGETRFEKAVAALSKGTSKDTFNPSSRGIGFKKTVFEAIGGYDETVLAGEDTHFNWKWRNGGYKYVHVPQAKIHWRVRPSMQSLYKMQRRNVTGSVILHNPWGWKGIALRLSILCLFLGLAGVGGAMAYGGKVWFLAFVGLGGWLFSVLYRTTTRGRCWHYLCSPLNFIYAMLAILAMDLGTWSGTLRGWIQRWKS